MHDMSWLTTLGGIVFLAAVFLVMHHLVRRSQRPVDYTKYPRTTATVVGDVPFYEDGLRQMVRLRDPEGREVLAMHNKRNLANLPEPDSVQQVYYWPVRKPAHYTYKHQTIPYYFHYCDERIYDNTKRIFH